MKIINVDAALCFVFFRNQFGLDFLRISAAFLYYTNILTVPCIENQSFKINNVDHCAYRARTAMNDAINKRLLVNNNFNYVVK